MTANNSSSGLKCFLMLLNGIFFICGAALLVIGVYLTWFNDSWKDYLKIVNLNLDDVDIPDPNVDTENTFIQYTLYLAIGIGGFVVVITLLGFCGACKENSCMLTMYCFLLTLTIFGEVAMAVLAVIYKEDIESGLEDNMSKQAKENVGNNDSITEAWYAMQKQFNCCGGSGYKDYRENSNFNDTVPITCCVLDDSADKPKALNETLCFEEAMSDSVDPDDFQYLHSQGCYDSLVKWVEDRIWFFVIGGAIIAALQLLGVIVGCCLKGRINSR